MVANELNLISTLCFVTILLTQNCCDYNLTLNVVTLVFYVRV